MASHMPSTDDDTSRLWYMKLGCATECALQSLVKQGLLKGTKGKLEVS